MVQGFSSGEELDPGFGFEVEGDLDVVPVVGIMALWHYGCVMALWFRVSDMDQVRGSGFRV